MLQIVICPESIGDQLLQGTIQEVLQKLSNTYQITLKHHQSVFSKIKAIQVRGELEFDHFGFYAQAVTATLHDLGLEVKRYADLDPTVRILNIYLPADRSRIKEILSVYPN